MSILNMPSDGLFNVAVVLVRALVRFGPRPRDELLLSCGFGVDAIDPAQLTRTLNRWTELGLFAAEGAMVTLREPYRAELGKAPDIAERRLPKVMRMIALAPENNLRFWEAEENKSADLSRGLSWILAQDVYTLDTGSHSKIQALEAKQVADKSRCMLQNDTRWNGLRTWMIYLGFARGGPQVTVDPTHALREALPDIFGDERVLPARVFVDRVAQALPVFDSGAYRRQVEGTLTGPSWTPPPDGMLSTSFSRAIKRLDHEGLVAAEQRSDTEDGVSLVGANQRRWRRMTHVRRILDDKGE
ncbi:protein DpdG [Azospirillum isscasi]|uniref:Protein DpdG n=1 Tax=Azospirillum isscasi TaxID=3053926 RepID=A0ABU0WDD4_9PROT|nr:protein DpdG [Azospirillum isscasi]MDQ2102190.1 protein DpdG [Azospirillum isscasi]